MTAVDRLLVPAFQETELPARTRAMLRPRWVLLTALAAALFGTIPFEGLPVSIPGHGAVA